MSIDTGEFDLPKVEKVKTEGEASDLAISWQHWFGENSISYGETIYYQNYFLSLVDKFPQLREEFSENGII